MVSGKLEDQIDRELYNIDTGIYVDDKGKVFQSDLYDLIQQARINIAKILSKHGAACITE